MKNNNEHRDKMSELIALKKELAERAKELKNKDFGLTPEEELKAAESLIKLVQEMSN